MRSISARGGRAIVVALTTLTLLPAGAAAAPGDHAGMTVAQAKWGTPACGQPQLLVRAPSAYEREYAVSLGGRSPVAWADVERCAIVVNPEYRIYTSARRCHVIVHEWGHLAGYRDPSNTVDPLHSDDPRSVMYARDEVVETPRFRGHRTRWVAAGAYPPCYGAEGNRMKSKGTE